MKTTKRILAVVLAVLMLAAMMVIPASAAVTTDYSITITDSNENHTYKVYQIFTGTLHDSVLTEIQWGSGVNSTGQNAYGNASSKASTLTSEALAQAFAQDLIAKNYLGTPVKEGSPSNGTFTADNLAAGYYLITDALVDDTLDNQAYSHYIIQVVGKVSIQPKAGHPAVKKLVSRDGTSYAEGISASIGDTVYYKMAASLHNHVNDYPMYYLQFKDVLADGLTYNSGSDFVGVYVENGSVKEELDKDSYSVAYDATTHTLTVTFMDIHAPIFAATSSKTAVADTIVVYYKATLNDKVTIGNPGEENTAVLHYSNDPTETYTGTSAPANQGTTTKDVATVYTYGLSVKKIDATSSDDELKGATFVVYRMLGGTTKQYLKFDEGQFAEYTNNEAEATPLTTDEEGLLSVTGLGSGTYWLHETAAPAGYNLNKQDVSVTFKGALDGNTGKLGTIDASQAHGNSVAVETNSAGDPTGMITVTITNTKGAQLPTTGGIGTTIFYVVGVVLVLGAVLVLATKKRGNA